MRQRCNAIKTPRDQRTCWTVDAAPVHGSCVASPGKVGVLPTSVMFSTAPDSIVIEPICPPNMPPIDWYGANVAVTAVAPLYRCVGPHAAMGGAVHVMHDEHTSVTGVPMYAGIEVDEGIIIPPISGAPPADEVTFSNTCAPVLSAGKPVRLSTPPFTKPQGKPVAVENRAPLFTVGPDVLIKPQSTVTPAFSRPVTDWLAASATATPLAIDAGVMPANVEIA